MRGGPGTGRRPVLESGARAGARTGAEAGSETAGARTGARPRAGVVGLWLVAGCLVAGGLLAACRGSDDSTEGLYRRHCARCHGLDGTGNPRAVARQPGLDLTRPEILEDRDEIRRQIVEGEGTMPAFGKKLDPEQIDRLVALTEHLAGGGEMP